MITVSNIANATRGELLCISYEFLLEEIQKAIVCENIEEREKSIAKAVEMLKMLTGDLDFRYEMAHELFRIYVYVQGLLIQGKSKEKYEEAYKLINKIYSAYKQIAENETDEKPVMQNAETIYAGFTYGKDHLNEMRLNDINRGFKA